MKYYLTISLKNKYVWFPNTKCIHNHTHFIFIEKYQIDEEYQQDRICSEYCSLQYANFYKFAFIMSNV